ncbi:hypothetical protein Dsin_010620 [Dipteronia sinensis]|uniref:AAA+ ATPase domain-containing protein n=1 Tax=Dipteronia sinensis TaxID=43782 RepID=A0AAE0ATL9_9ROSI|nr:hypothetical protein Dsin_010620 [Dipteronia sinensis]
MFSLTRMPSTTSVFSAYTTVAASTMLVRTVISDVQSLASQLIPRTLQEKILSRLEGLSGKFSSQLTITIDESSGLSVNEIYQAADMYLSTRITPSIEQLKVSKEPQEKDVSVTINKGQKIIDTFEGILLTWEFVSTATQKTSFDGNSGFYVTETAERKSIQLSFHKKYMEKVLRIYLPYIVEKMKSIKENKKAVKLYSLGSYSVYNSINLDHPSTFETMAMDRKLKKELMDDLDRFLKRRGFYKRVGKAWKRGYLLYGPPGTGKSSLIAAMANYLKFDIYDLELASLRSNSDLRGLLVSTGNRSILVIEDIDCSIELENRQSGGYKQDDSQITLSGLLNFVDGLWSSCGDERIIVFTTNYKERLDPALLRPGRMDMHIHLSYLTPDGFRILASNYLNIKSHPMFPEIEQLINEAEVTPAEVAEELMKSEENADAALKGVVDFLARKKKEQNKCGKSKVVEEGKDEDNENEEENGSKKMDEKRKRGGKKNKKREKMMTKRDKTRK